MNDDKFEELLKKAIVFFILVTCLALSFAVSFAVINLGLDTLERFQ